MREQRNKSVAYRLNINAKKGQSTEDAIKDRHDLLKRIADDGLTEEEKQKIYKRAEEESKKWEEYKKEVGYGENHD